MLLRASKHPAEGDATQQDSWGLTMSTAYGARRITDWRPGFRLGRLPAENIDEGSLVSLESQKVGFGSNVYQRRVDRGLSISTVLPMSRRFVWVAFS
jgi:hypothetical protein